MAADGVLLLFARLGLPGQVKTRLIPALGEQGAQRVDAALFARTVAVIRRSAWPVVEVWTDEPARVRAAGCPAEWPCRRQRGEDLGRRMYAALRDALVRHRRAVLVGSDCASLTPAVLDAAGAALDNKDMVIAPAADGGYVLIGARGELRPEVFSGIDWGTGRVYAQTRARMAQCGLSAGRLPLQWDVDREADLPWLREQALAPGEHQLHALLPLLEAVVET